MKAIVVFDDYDDVGPISFENVREPSKVITRPRVSSIRDPHYTIKVQLNEEALIQKSFSNTSVLAYDEMTNKSDAVTEISEYSSRVSLYSEDDSVADNGGLCSPCRQAEDMFLPDDMTLDTIESEDFFDTKTFFSSLRLNCFTISAPRKKIPDQIKLKEVILLKSKSMVSATPLTRSTRLKLERTVNYEDSDNSICKIMSEDDDDTHGDTQEGEEVILKDSDVIMLDSTILIFDKNVNQLPQRKDNHVDNPSSLSGTKQSTSSYKNEENDTTKSKSSFSSTNPETKDERLVPLSVDIYHNSSSGEEENPSVTSVVSTLTDDNSAGKPKPSKPNRNNEVRHLRRLRILSQRHVAESRSWEKLY
eukprot:CAMPEP_0198289296 /NCGR_PEP_ID=MMETSP1449-20131203/7528_1 /TAXON_ID=420275 /ORGANISM="Attheya septentrionalis, Strain CCMP2084" /LENGTH=361 /DNA_ID=CAMNT_0043987601 /DNA_START=115 /DNA_END=1200 /DNA_ORIENTATION=+